MRATVLNFLGFQLVWFACVLGAAAGYPWLGPVLLAAVLALQRTRLSPKLLIAAAVTGFAAESIMTATGSIAFHNASSVPAWMVALWINFAATFGISLAWLEERYLIGSDLGAIAGPLSYFAGEKLGAITIHNAPAIGVEWAIATPLLLWLAKVLA